MAATTVHADAGGGALSRGIGRTFQVVKSLRP